MNEFYCVFKNGTNDRRRVMIEYAGEIYSDRVEFGENDINACQVQKVLKKLVRQRKAMECLYPRSEMPKDEPFSEVSEILEETCGFIRDEVVDSADTLEEMAQYGMTAWIDSDTDSYFELKTRNNHLGDVEVACAKLYIGTLKVHVVFLQGSYYCKVTDVETTEQSLEDDEFPDISSKGQGFQIKNYSEGGDFVKFALWQLMDDRAFNMKQLLQERRSSVEGKSASAKEEKLPDREDHDISHIDEEYLWGKSKEAFGGSYTQTYLLLAGEEGKGISHRALFRYGNWCYGGYVDIDQEVTLHEVPHVLRKFQRQQGKLAYWFEIQSLPEGLPFTAPMKHFAMASAFLEEEIVRAEPTLTQLTEYHKSKGIPPWINEETGRQFFELETSGDQLHYDEVKLMASKTYFQGVVVITIYFQGSFYMTLSPSVDDQPLLDMSFPDVESRGRALQISTYSHNEFKKLMLWESTRSVWETANRAVLEQRRQAALKRERELAEETQHQEVAVDEIDEVDEEETEPESKTGIESKEVDSVALKRETKKKQVEVEGEDASGEYSRKGSANPLRRSSLEQKQQGGGSSRSVHHLKPLGKLGGSGKLPALNKDLCMDAPWDALGRPKNLFANSKK